MSADNPNDGHDDGEKHTRRDFIHIAAITAAAGGVAALAWPLIDQMNPSGDTLAMASIEYDYAKVALGQQVVIKWRGKPVFIRHRTPKEIAEAKADDHAEMRDPATDASRVKPGKEDWLILIGVCTHLGCVPNFGGGALWRLALPLPRFGLRHSRAHPGRPGAPEPVFAGLHIHRTHQGQDRLIGFPQGARGKA